MSTRYAASTDVTSDRSRAEIERSQAAAESAYEQAVRQSWRDPDDPDSEPLYMRAAGDRRRDSIVKAELFDAHVRDHYNVRLVLDDRNQVVRMWRSLGLTCLQVADGDF